MTTGFITPDGRFRRDEEAVDAAVALLRGDRVIAELVDEVGARPVAPGSFGLLIPARLRDSGRDVVVKMNANEHERRWLPAISEIDPGAVPEVHAVGARIDGVELGWMVMERLPHQPPGFGGVDWYGTLLRGAFRWHAAALRVDAEPWHAIDGPWLTMWIDQILATKPSSELERLRARFDDDWAWVCDVCGPLEPAHGDVHFFNAASREPDIPEALVLFDPIPRAAHWPYDAANCHVLTNYERIVPGGESLVAMAARDRHARGLPTPDDAAVKRLSDLFCAWLSVMWLAHLGTFQPDRRESSAVFVRRAIG